MTPRPVLVDTAVIAYALGGSHELREPCRTLLQSAANGALQLHASVEMVQELLFHRMRRTNRVIAVQQARDAGTLCELHAFDQSILDVCFDLIGSIEHLRGRDAVHAATALHNGISEIVSPDSAFDSILGLTRIGPIDLARQLDR